MQRRGPLASVTASIVALASSLLVPGSARAQGASGDGAAAQILWEEGRTHAQEGNFEAACPKFAESHRLDPQLGTLLNLADCYARIGKVASSWAKFVEAEEMAKARQDKREAEAKRRAAELEPKLIRFELSVPDPAPDMTIRRDDEEIAEPLWGTAVPVDPGTYTIVAEAPGYLPWQEEIALTEEGSTIELEVPPLEPAPDDARDERSTRDTAGGDGLSTGLLVSGIVSASLGAVGLGVGTAFLVIAKNKDDDSLAFCEPDDPTSCDARGVRLRDEALTAQTIGIAGMVTGGVLVATGTAFIISSVVLKDDGGDDVALAPWAGPHGAGVVGRLRF